MTRTLVVSPNWVGDLVMALPVFDALAGSGRELVALAKPGLHPLLRLIPGVAARVAKEGSDAATVAGLRKASCAEAVILPNSFRSAWLARRAGIPVRWGYRGNLRSALLSKAVRRPRVARHQGEMYRELLIAMGIETPAALTMRLDPDVQARRAGDDALDRADVPVGRQPLIGLFPGAEFGPSKRWPIERFVDLSKALRRAAPNTRQLLLAGPGDVWISVRIHEQTGKILPVVGADLDLAGLAGLIARLDLLVTNDSGPMHLAAALGVPCVALFGPTDPTLTAPWGDEHAVFYTDRWCSPCFKRKCPLLHHKCMKEIEPAAVAARAVEGLSHRS